MWRQGPGRCALPRYSPVGENSLLPIDGNELAREVVEEHLKINGPREEARYELELYRTELHYRWHRPWDVIYCDAGGKILLSPFA